MTRQSNLRYYLRLTLTLFLITAIVAALLGAVNTVTAGRIESLRQERTQAAMREVLAADDYVPAACDEPGVLAIHAALRGGNLAGYVVEVAPAGFGGAIDMVVGVDLAGAVTGVSIVSMAETSGLGDNAKKESFRSQFVGGSGQLAVTRDGGTIDALTGATVTSRAVTSGVNTAIAAVASVRGAE